MTPLPSGNGPLLVGLAFSAGVYPLTESLWHQNQSMYTFDMMLSLYVPLGIFLLNWSLTSLQQRLVKTGGRLVKQARYSWLLLAEGHLNRRPFAAMLGRLALLPVPAG